MNEVYMNNKSESDMPHQSSSNSEEYARFLEMTGREREALIKRTSRIVFDEEFSRDTTQATIYRTAEAVVQKIDVKRIIKETAVEVAKGATEASRESSKEIATDTAKAMLKEAFLLMDMDPSSREDTREFRADIRFVRGLRKIIGDSWSKAAGLVLVALMGAAIYGAWTHLSNGPPKPTTNTVTINPTPPAQAGQTP